MIKYNPKNERLKHEYFRFLAEADGRSAATIDGIRKALLRFEEYNRLKDFSTFNREQAIGFKKYLTETKAERSGKPLSLATIFPTLNHLKAFFKWVAQQPGYKSKIHLPDINYFSLTDKENRAAKATPLKKFPTLEQIQQVIRAMPDTDEVAKRNRALIAFTITTGIRVQAMTSLKIKHVDLERSLVSQDPREVKTKFSKQINTYFFPVGGDIQKICIDWFHYLQKEKLYGYDAPLFPRTCLKHDVNLSFQAAGLVPEHWTTSSPIRCIFRDAFEAAGLPYYHPHSFRHTLGHLMRIYCKDIEDIQAWSLNLGHESPVTTFTSYGHMDPYRQGEVLKELSLTP
ncbi:MAG: tyrosine-type recombinase/integrase [Deltaproteobacteria bacterium]|nr:MAG: tyrosine-type recombinase/integrase [Deltaproteobacteria bacterium]